LPGAGIEIARDLPCPALKVNAKRGGGVGDRPRRPAGGALGLLAPDPQNLAGGAGIVTRLAQAPGIAQTRFVLAPANQTGGGRGGRQGQALAPDAGEGELGAYKSVEPAQGSAGAEGRVRNRCRVMASTSGKKLRDLSLLRQEFDRLLIERNEGFAA